MRNKGESNNQAWRDTKSQSTNNHRKSHDSKNPLMDNPGSSAVMSAVDGQDSSSSLNVTPAMAGNLVDIKQLVPKQMCVVTLAHKSGVNLGNKHYAPEGGGRGISYSDIVPVLKENDGEKDNCGTPFHWLNYLFSHKYEEMQFKHLEKHGIYKKHLYALACLNYYNGPKLSPHALLNLMKESSLVLAHALSPGLLNYTLSEDQWKALLCEQSFADLFMSEEVKKRIKECHTTLGTTDEEAIKGPNRINYPALKLSVDQIPDLLSSTSYAEAFGMLSVKNQSNLRKALKHRARTSFQYFHEFLNNFPLQPDEYDELASDLVLAGHSSQAENNACYCSREDLNDYNTNFMLCEVVPGNTDNFIKYLNSLAPGNRISVLTSQRLRLSCETEGGNVNVKIIAHELFFLEDLSFQNVMDVFKSLYSDGQPVYDQDSRKFCLNFNNAAIKKDINDLLKSTWKSFVRDYKLILTLRKGGGQCSDGEFLLDLFQWSGTFRSIYNQCCDKEVWHEEQQKSVDRRRHVRLTADYMPGAAVGETKDEDINLRPLSSVRLRELAQTLTLNKDYKNAVKVFLMALEQSSEKRLIMDDLVKLFSNNQIRAHVKDFFLTMARTVTVFIESELKKSELEGNGGGADWIDHLVWMVELDLQRKKLLTWQGSTANFAINHRLVDELKTQTIHFSGLQSTLFAGPRSCLAEVWKKLSSFRKPGSVDWQKDLLFSYIACPGDAEALGLMEMLSKNFYNTALSHNKVRDVYTDKDRLILRAVYFRLLLLLGTNPEEGQGSDRAEAIDECFRLVESDNRGEQVSKEAANKVRSFFIEKLRDYKRLKDQYERDSIQEQRESGGGERKSCRKNSSDVLNEAYKDIDYHFRDCFFSLVALGPSFINVLAEYASDNPEPIADYSSRDVDNLYVQAETDPKKLALLIEHTFGPSQNDGFMLSKTCATTLLHLLRKHADQEPVLCCIWMIVKKVKSEINRVVSMNENMQTMSWSDKYALLNESIRDAFNLFEFRLKLPGNVESVMFTQLEQLIKRLEGVTNVLYQYDKEEKLSLQCCLNSWSALDRIIHSERFLKTPDQYLQVKLMIIGCSLRGLQIYSAIRYAMYEPHFLTDSYDKYHKFHAAIKKCITEVADHETVWQHVDVISARRLVFSRLAYFLHEAVRLGHSDDAIINHHVKGLSSCYQDVSFKRKDKLMAGSDMIAEFRQELKRDFSNAVEQLKRTVYPVIMSEQIIKFLISIIFIEGNEKENYDTLSLKQRLDNLYKPDHIGSSEFSDALVPAKESSGSHRGETKSQFQGQSQSHESTSQFNGFFIQQTKTTSVTMLKDQIKRLEIDLCRQLIVARLKICGSDRDELRPITISFRRSFASIKALASQLQKWKDARFFGYIFKGGRLYSCICQSLKEVEARLPLLSVVETVEVEAHKKERAQPPSSKTTLFSQSNRDETPMVKQPTQQPSSWAPHEEL